MTTEVQDEATRSRSDVDNLQHLVCPLCDPDRALCGYDKKSPYYRRTWAEVPRTRMRCAVCVDLDTPHRPHIRLLRELER